MLKTIPFQNPASALIRARAAAGLTLRALAAKAGTSHATLAAYEQNRKSPNAETFLRVLAACDCSLSLTMRSRIRSKNGLERGKELVQVLDLAAQFPAGHTAVLDAPVFGQNR